MNIIHPTAIIDSTALLGSNNYIGPYCYIGPNVSIGDNNRLEAYVSIGTPAEHASFWLEPNKNGVVIGSNCVIREFVTINSGTTKNTELESNIYLLTKSHVGHDALIEGGVTISCGAIIGGHAVIMKGANIGLNVAIHQRQVVGSFSMLGMGTVVTKTTEVSPGWIYVGNPARRLKMNKIGLEKNNITDSKLESERNRYLNFFTKGLPFEKNICTTTSI